MIDEEIRRLVEEGEKTAHQILTDHADELEIIAQGLLEYETLDRAEIDDLLKGNPVSRNAPDDSPPIRRYPIFGSFGWGLPHCHRPQTGRGIILHCRNWGWRISATLVKIIG